MNNMDMLKKRTTKFVKEFDKVIDRSGIKDKYNEIINDIPDDEIIYLTGMSINKKTFNNVYNLVSKDESFELAQKSLISDIETIDKWRFENQTDNQIESITKELSGDFGKSLLVSAISIASGAAGIVVSLAITLLLELYSLTNNRITENTITDDKYNFFSKELLLKITENKKDLINNIEGLSWSDFFAVYQSNQSDIRGLNSMSSEGQLHNKFVLHYGYADKPFYENLFINSLKIDFSGRLLNKIDSTAISKLYDNVYKQHTNDIIFSKVLKNIVIDIIKNSQDFKDMLSNDAIEVFKDSLDNRNLFGIDLLSRFLFQLVNQLESTDNKLKIFINTDFITNDYITNKLKNKKDITKAEIDRQHLNEKERIKSFTKEIWEYGSSPVYFEFTEDKQDADIVVSAQYLDNKEFYPLNETIKENIKANTNSCSIQIPIKIFVSLPIILNDNGEQIPTRKIFIPERLVHNAEDNGVMNIYTVGGIEHNRPLMKLINLHRQEKKEERILGFFDNRFDFVHKFNHKGASGFFHYFLMGANQPVSGLNAYHYSRFDDQTGNSISTDAKLIYFNIEEENSKFNNGKKLTYHIISIYGFSALASAYATLWSIINIKESLEKINNEEGYKSSLAFQALDISDKNQINDNIHVFTKRVKFLEADKMETRLKEICNGVEPFSFLRLEYTQPEDKRKLVKFMYGQPGTKNAIAVKAEAVVDTEDGSSTSKQNIENC